MKRGDPTAGVGTRALVDLGIANEVTGKQRNRVFAYRSYLDVLSKGVEVR